MFFMQKKVKISNLLLIAAILLQFGVLLNAKSNLISDEIDALKGKDADPIAYKNSQGVVVAYGGTCKKGDDECVANDCPAGTSPQGNE
jgi:1,4-dihydroxy-2-naphthoate octaprenyltransferase